MNVTETVASPAFGMFVLVVRGYSSSLPRRNDLLEHALFAVILAAREDKLWEFAAIVSMLNGVLRASEDVLSSTVSILDMSGPMQRLIQDFEVIPASQE